MSREYTNYLMLHFKPLQLSEIQNSTIHNINQLEVRAKKNLELVKDAQREGDSRMKTQARKDAERNIQQITQKKTKSNSNKEKKRHKEI